MGRTSCRAAAAAFAIGLATLALSACGGDSTPSAAADSCPITERSAKQLLRASTVVRGAPPAITGLAPPRVHCMYASADKSVQLTVFTGADMMRRFGQLVQTAMTVPALGADARCTTTTLGGQAGASCLFPHRGDTYILSARVPPAASAPLLGDVTKLAEKIAAQK